MQISSDHWTEKGATKRMAYLNVGREDGNWKVAKLDGRKFWQKSYRVHYVRPSNY